MSRTTSSYPDLAGQVTLVTGGASGIDLAMAKGFAEQGCHLILLDINEAALSEAAKQGRIAFREEIAQLAIFLASNASSHITGQVIAVDGGWTAYGYV